MLETQNQRWFEMQQERRKSYNSSVWIPLRAMLTNNRQGTFGHINYTEDIFQVGTLAVPLKYKTDALKLDWNDIGLIRNQCGYCEDNKYIPSDIYQSFTTKLPGLFLVLSQPSNHSGRGEWYLHQDFIVTMGLVNEGDVWVCPNYGYEEVAKITRDSDGKPTFIEVKAEYLKDYLCARQMGLRIVSFRSRQFVYENKPSFSWDNDELITENEIEKLQASIKAIHQGGEAFGTKMAVFHTSRKDVDELADIPDMSSPETESNTDMTQSEYGFTGKKLYRVLSNLWKNEWIDPSILSPKVRGDKADSPIEFIIDEKGTKASDIDLRDNGKWLWFYPEIIPTLIRKRGGELNWYTRDTGEVGLVGNNVHFGINKSGLVNVFADDISLLPSWIQKIWAGFNLTPEGGVSEELIASQVHANPASTKAPEEYLESGLDLLFTTAKENLKINILNKHSSVKEILKNIHRFRALDKNGLFSLAKDLTRVFTDDINTSALQTIKSPPKSVHWGSLKSLENVLKSKMHETTINKLMCPFYIAYDLRLGDSHLPSSDVQKRLNEIGIDTNQPYIFQGYGLINACVSTIYELAEILKVWNQE